MFDVDALEWLVAHIRANVAVATPLGMRWLIRASTHLEERIEAELRRTR